MSLEEYKKKVYEYLVNLNKVSPTVAESLMKEYENDFQEFLEENYEPNVVSYGILTHLL